MMKSLQMRGTVAIAACLLFGAGAMAQTVSSSEFSAGKTRIKAQYKADQKSCASLADNAKDICIAEAKGKEDVALAELDHKRKPTLKSQHKMRVAEGEATYGVAMQKCDDLAGNEKDVCVTQAKAALVTTKADADVEMKTSAANATANEKSADATANASAENKETRAAALADKRAAQLKVAEEKCDALAGAAKDKCMASAKAKFGTS
jgi:hypothetical protein